MHTTERYQYCIFPENVRPLHPYSYGTKVMGQGRSAQRRLKNEPLGHYVVSSSG